MLYFLNRFFIHPEYIRPGPFISKTLLLESNISCSVPGHTNALYCVLRINIYYTTE